MVSLYRMYRLRLLPSAAYHCTTKGAIHMASPSAPGTTCRPGGRCPGPPAAAGRAGCSAPPAARPGHRQAGLVAGLKVFITYMEAVAACMEAVAACMEAVAACMEAGAAAIIMIVCIHTTAYMEAVAACMEAVAAPAIIKIVYTKQAEAPAVITMP